MKKKASLKFSAGTYMQLDIWVPRHKICFEFQVFIIFFSSLYTSLVLITFFILRIHTITYQPGIVTFLERGYGKKTVSTLLVVSMFCFSIFCRIVIYGLCFVLFCFVFIIFELKKILRRIRRMIAGSI